MIVVYEVVLRTKPSGLYRHREDLGLHKVSYKEGNLHIRSSSLPSMPRRVLSRHEYSLRSSYLHSPSVRPMVNRPDARGPLNPGLLQKPPNQASMTRCSARRLSSTLQGRFLLRRPPSRVFGFQFNTAPLGFCAFMTSSSTCPANVDSQGIFFANITLALQERVSI